MTPPEESGLPDSGALPSGGSGPGAPEPRSPEQIYVPDTWRRALFIIGTILSLVLLGVASHWALRIGRAPWTSPACRTCHVMEAEFINWSRGPHSQVACVQCHGRVDLPRFAFAQVTGSFRQPVVSQDEVATQTCLGCHKFDRQITPTDDLVIAHSFHVRLNLDCVRCHTYLVHGPPGGNPDAVEADFSQRVPMERCQTCHNGTMAPSACGTCHKDQQPQPKAQT